MIKDIPPEFSLQDLMAFIEGEREEVAEGYHTAREWAAHFKVSPAKMRRVLVQAKGAGRLDIIETMGTSALTGRAYPTWVYAFQAPEEKET